MDYDSPEYVRRVVDDAVAAAAPGGELRDYRAAQIFQTEGSTWGGLKRLFGRGGDDGAPRLESSNLLVLTDERLHIYGVKSKRGAWVPTGTIGDWPLSDLRVGARQDRLEYGGASSGTDIGKRADVIRVEIEIVPTRQLLHVYGMLWGEDRTITETVEALLAATGSEAGIDRSV